MRFTANQHRIENTDQSEVSLQRTNDMSIMLIKNLGRFGSKRKYPTQQDSDQLALPGEAIVGFRAMLMLKLGAFGLCRKQRN